MSNGDDDDIIIICGSGGEPEGEVQITMYKASVMGVAIAVSKSGMLAYDGVTERDVRRFKRMVHRHWEQWAEELERLGIPYQKHYPHPLPPQE